MGIFNNDTSTKEQMVGLTPHGREVLETDAVELNQAESSVMYFLKENSAKSLKGIANGTTLPYSTVRYIVNDLVRKRLAEYVL